MEARVQGCVTCHGQSGQGTSNEYFPRIAGKPAAYLYNQLVAFRDGKRVYPPMNYLVAYLPDAYLKDIAEHFAKERPAFEAKQQTTAAASVISRGATLAISGDAEQAGAAMHHVPWPRPDRHGARHPGTRGPALLLHRGAAHALANRQPASCTA